MSAVTNEHWTLVFDLSDMGWSRDPSALDGSSSLEECTPSRSLQCNHCGEEFQPRLPKHPPVGNVMAPESRGHASDEFHSHFERYVQEMKARHGELLHMHAMFNISAPVWQVLRSRFPRRLFEGVFVSCEYGMCKPELQFYQKVLQEIQTPPTRTVFVERDQDNVVAARSFGACGILVTGMSNLRSQLLNIVEDPAKRGRDFMSQNGGNLYSLTEKGDEICDNFSQLLIYEATGDIGLVKLEHGERTWNYFIGEQDLIPGTYPDDTDTTSLALLHLPVSEEAAHSVMDEMLSLRTADGIIMTYFDPQRPRTDPMVCVNILRLFYHYGRGLDPSLQYVLLHRAYLNGTRYYTSPDIFLFYLSQLALENPGSDICKATVPLLISRLMERINTEGDSIELSMRSLACQAFGIRNELDVRRLMSLQSDDGGWKVGWLCRTGKKGIRIGNRGVATALAVNALENTCWLRSP